MSPEVQADIRFVALPVNYTMACYICPEEIKPETDNWAIHFTFPSHYSNIAHPDCLEQLGWVILNYVKDTAGTMVPESVTN